MESSFFSRILIIIFTNSIVSSDSYEILSYSEIPGLAPRSTRSVETTGVSNQRGNVEEHTSHICIGSQQKLLSSKTSCATDYQDDAKMNCNLEEAE